MTNTEFERNSKNIQMVFDPKANYTHDFHSFDCIVKGDVSGIQDFVFKVKSDKASKTLKARSYFIKIACDLCIELLKVKINTDYKVLYNGGGSFYLMLKYNNDLEQNLNDVRNIINNNFWQEELSLNLSLIKFTQNELKDNFNTVWSKLQEESARQKVKRFDNFFTAFQEGFPLSKTTREWDDFTETLLQIEDLKILPSGKDFTVLKNEISLFGFTWLIKKGEMKNGLPFGLPLWQNGETLLKHREEARNTTKEDVIPSVGNIVSFEYLAKFAMDRTGTKKLGVLKLDVDDLGKKFSECNSVGGIEKLSNSLKWFFEVYLLQDLIGRGTFSFIAFDKIKQDDGNETWELKPKIAFFKDNIYVVFSGGDDTFLIGAWDAVFKIASQIKSDFEKMVGKNLTLSASLLLVGSHFPVARMADLAEEALHEAKTIILNSKGKISVFGKVLTWAHFLNAEKSAASLQSLIQFENEPRSILERIRKASNILRQIIIDAKAGKVNIPPLWNLFYSIRNAKNRDKIEELIKDYYAGIALAYTEKTEHPLYTEILPVAVRWAEFLTRNTPTNKK
jgi:CRISPR-associated protein Csm1